MGRDGTETITVDSNNNNSSNSNSNIMSDSLNASISTSDTGAIGTCIIGAPAQTASIGYSDMMTFLPEGSNGAEQAQQQQQQQADEDEIARFSAGLDELLATATTMATAQSNAVVPQGEISPPSQQVTVINPTPQTQSALPTYLNMQQAQQQTQGPIIAATGTPGVQAPSTGYTTTSLEQSCVSSFPFGMAQPPPPPPASCPSQNAWPPTSNTPATTSSTTTTSAATTAATPATSNFPAVTSLPIAATGISYPPLPSNPYNPPWSTTAQTTTQNQTSAQQPQQSWNPAPPDKRTRKATTGTKRRAASISTNKKTQLPVLTTPMTTLPTMGPSQLQHQIKAVSEYDDSGTDDPSTSTSKRKYNHYSTPTSNISFMNPNNVTSATSISESEKSKKRRQDRNLREQERAHRITAQISHLRNVLASANIRFKPDKYSTLISVVEYIKTLQRRSALLDEEHRKLLDTISRTGEMVNGIHHQQKPGGNPTGTVNYDSAAVVTRSTATTTTSNDSATTANPAESTTASASSSSSSSINDGLMVFVRGLDYKSIFSHCGVALGVASVDGRFIDANDEFVYWSGYTREELLGTTSSSVGSAATTSLPPSSSLSSCSSETSTQHRCMGGKHLSLFNLLSREDMERVFSAMSKMLKSTSSAGTASGGDKDKNERGSGGGAVGNDPGGGAYVDEGNHWTGVVRKSRRRAPDIPLRLNITMVRSSDGRPKFFNCALTPEDDT